MTAFSNLSVGEFTIVVFVIVLMLIPLTIRALCDLEDAMRNVTGIRTTRRVTRAWRHQR